MAIPDEDVAQVRAATDIVALVSEYTPLKRVGRRFTGLCPFHSEKSASFSVNAEEGLYYCFGCQASGDAITFLRNIEALDFVEAVERLATRAGITVRNDAGARDNRHRRERAALEELMGKAIAFYHDELLKGASGAAARQYLRSRGYDGDVVRQFSLGWAPESGSALVKALKGPRDLLVTAGLAHDGQYGLRDAFRGRVIFPIFDPSGKPIALGGRILPGSGDGVGPKYRNSPETPVYTKSKTLYGLNWARQGAVKANEVVVCEGYTDVIGLFTVGLPRAVATCGTALTEDHFRLLGRFAKRVVLAFDADAAGQGAAARFYAWEKSHELEVAVATLPAGSDPADLARTDPEALRAAVEGAQTFLSFRVNRALEGVESLPAEGKAKAAETALEMIAEHPNDLVRDQYLVTVADRTRVALDHLRPRLERLVAEGPRPADGTRGKRAGTASPAREEEPPWEPDGGGFDDGEAPFEPGDGRRTNGPTTPGGRPSAGQRAGRDALALAVHDPASMAGRLDGCLFADPTQRAAFEALAGAASLHEAIEAADDDVADLLRQLAVIEPEADADETVIALARTAAQVALGEIEADARQADASGDPERLAAAGAAISWLKLQLETLQDPNTEGGPPAGATEMTAGLVAWLAQRHVG